MHVLAIRATELNRFRELLSKGYEKPTFFRW